MSVAVASTKKGVKQALQRILEQTSYQPLSNQPLLIKPNLAAAIDTRSSRKQSEKILTSQALMRAICESFPNREIILAEGSAIGFSTSDVFRILRLEQLPVTLVDLDTAPRKNVDWKFGTIKLPKILFTSEYWNLPKMKTHIQTSVTLGLKNQKGLLADCKKLHFHAHGLHEHITALAHVVKPHYTIVDGIHAMEGNGPSVGKIIHPQLLFGGSDHFEVDRAGCYLMGINPEEVLHLGPGPVQWTEQNHTSFVRQFKRPQMPFHINIGRIQVDWHDACTGCMLALKAGTDYMVADKKNWPILAKYGLLKGLRIAMGHVPESIPDQPSVLLFGKCACLANKKEAKQLLGCPPDPQKFLDLLKEKK